MPERLNGIVLKAVVVRCVGSNPALPEGKKKGDDGNDKDEMEYSKSKRRRK